MVYEINSSDITLSTVLIYCGGTFEPEQESVNISALGDHLGVTWFDNWQKQNLSIDTFLHVNV